MVSQRLYDYFVTEVRYNTRIQRQCRNVWV